MNLIKHSRFAILHFKVFKVNLVMGSSPIRNYTVDKFENNLLMHFDRLIGQISLIKRL